MTRIFQDSDNNDKVLIVGFSKKTWYIVFRDYNPDQFSLSKISELIMFNSSQDLKILNQLDNLMASIYLHMF